MCVICHLSSSHVCRHTPQTGTWREGGRNSAPQPPPATPASGRCPAPAAPPASHGRPGSAWRSVGTHPSTRPSPRAAASRFQREQPRAAGRGLPGPWARSPPGCLRGAAAAGAAGLPPARVTCAQRGSPASPPRPRRSGDTGAPEADTAARSPARPRRPPPPPPPARTNSCRRTDTGGARSCPAAAAPLSLRPCRCLEGTSGERLPAGPRLRLGAVNGLSSVALPPKMRPHGLARWCPAGGRAGEGGEERVGDGGGGKGLLRGVSARNGEKRTEGNGPAQPREEMAERGSHQCL